MIHDALIRNYTAPGPVAEQFIMDVKNRLVGIMGPYGSGKTSACPVKGLRLAQLQPKLGAEKVRYCKGYVIRQTYRDLWDKTLDQWLKVFPDCPQWPLQGSRGNPAKQTIRLDTPEIGKVVMFVEFRAIGEQNYKEFAAGLLATWIWINEGDSTPGEAIGHLMGRLGRYPEPHRRPKDYTPGPCQLFLDLNAPLNSNWVVQRLIKNPKPRDKLYIQPSGFSAHAENMAALSRIDPHYYQTMADDMEPWQVKRFIENKIGFSRAGNPVYTDFSMEQHVLATDRPPAPDLPVIIGVDLGSQPAAVMMQAHGSGRLHVFDHLVVPDGSFCDAESFGEQVAQKLASQYPGLAALVVPDPANFSPDPGVKDGMSWAQHFARGSRLPLYRPLSNDPGVRQAAVKHFLNTMAGGAALMQINPSLLSLIEGFAVNYRIKRKRDGSGEFADRPEKNHASHEADAMQYGALAARGDASQISAAIMASADTFRAIQGTRAGVQKPQFLDHGYG